MYIQLNMFTAGLFEFYLFDATDQVVMRSTFMYTTLEEAEVGAMELKIMLGCPLLDILGDLIT